MSTCDDQLMLTFESMHEFFEDNKKDQCEDQAYKETKKPSFKHLGAQIKHIILFASAPKPYHEPSTKCTPFAALFLEEAIISKAATTLQQELNGRNINFVVSQSLVTALFLGHFTWSCPDFPLNLSIFYCEKPAQVGYSNVDYQAKAFMLQDGVDKSDLLKAIKQSIHIPSSFMDGLAMSRNFHALLALFFGDESQVAKVMSAWIGHMLKWEAVNKTKQSDDPAFVTQVLFAIDSMVKLHLDSCQHAKSMDDVNDKILYFFRAQQKVFTMEFT